MIDEFVITKPVLAPFRYTNVELFLKTLTGDLARYKKIVHLEQNIYSVFQNSFDILL